MTVFTFVNQKGGVGKTTTAVSVAAAMSLIGKSVLVLDNDPQGHVARSFGVTTKGRTGMTEVYKEADLPISKHVVSSGDRVGRSNLKIIPSMLSLSDAEREAGNDLSDGLYRLADRAEEFMAIAEVLIIDCPPNLGPLSLNAFSLTKEILEKDGKGGLVVPVSMGMLDVDGLGNLATTVTRLHARGISPEILAYVPTMCETNTLITREVLSVLHSRYPEKVTGIVRKSVRFREAPALGQTIFEYDPTGSGSQDYAAVSEKLLKLAEEK